MNIFTKKLLGLFLLFGMVQVAFADKGSGKKTKAKASINICTTGMNLKKSVAFNLKSGLSYTGSLLTQNRTIGSSILSTSLITYQKGNITYILPYKHKLVIPEVRQGYTGMKMVIRSQN